MRLRNGKSRAQASRCVSEVDQLDIAQPFHVLCEGQPRSPLGQRHKKEPCKARVSDGRELLQLSPEIREDCRVQGSLHLLEQTWRDAEGYGHC